jgi:ATP-dependent Clp protease ATP-binding subunit ClpB
VVIMTSNIGSQVFGVSEGDEKDKEGFVLAALRGHFRPEFLNRVDDIVVFHPLAKEGIRKIVAVQMALLSGRLAERNLRLELTPSALDFLTEQGYDPVYGARPLKRAIQRMILDPLAIKLIEGTIHDGELVTVDVEGDGLAFRQQHPKAA